MYLRSQICFFIYTYVENWKSSCWNMFNMSQSDQLSMLATYLEYRCMRFCVCSRPWSSRWCSQISGETTILVILVYTLLGYVYLWPLSVDLTRTLKKASTHLIPSGCQTDSCLIKAQHIPVTILLLIASCPVWRWYMFQSTINQDFTRMIYKRLMMYQL